MQLYRKFTTFISGLIVVAMLAICVAQYFVFGFSQLNNDTGEVTYFFQTRVFLTSLLVALVYFVSLLSCVILPGIPQMGTLISLAAFGVTFYQMAIGDMTYGDSEYIVAAVVLLLGAIHVAGNALAWYDLWKQKKVQAENSADA